MIIPVTTAVLRDCLALAPNRISDGNISTGEAFAAWEKIVATPGTLARYEPGNRPDMPVRLFGCAVFVNDRFAEQEMADPRPGIHLRVVGSVAKGESVLLDYAGLSRANATDGVSIVILYSHAPTEKMTSEEVFAVKEGLATSFFRGQIGYRIKRLMVETVTDWDRTYLEETKAWRVFAEFGRRGEPGKPHPHTLAVITQEDSKRISGSVASMLFAYREPTLRFSPKEQEVLLHAIDGTTDDELHQVLGISLPGVKKRWGAIFARAEEGAPGLFTGIPGGKSGTRGRQRRHRVLAYLREHPEELRPYDPGV